MCSTLHRPWPLRPVALLASLLPSLPRPCPALPAHPKAAQSALFARSWDVIAEERRNPEKAADRPAADRVGELVAVSTLIDAIRSFVGERHCVRLAMVLLRAESMISLAMMLKTQDEDGKYPVDDALAARMLVTAISPGGNVAGGTAAGDDELNIVDAFMSVWRDLDVIWEHQEGSHEVRWWARFYTRFVAQLQAWGCARAFLARADAAAVDERFRAVRARSRLEAPKSKATKKFEEEVAALQRALDKTLAASGALTTSASADEGMVRWMVMMVFSWMLRSVQSATGLMLTDERRDGDEDVEEDVV